MTTLLRSLLRRHWSPTGTLLLTALLFGGGPAQAQTTSYCNTGLGGSCGGNDISDVSLSGTTLNATGLSCAGTGGQSYANYPATGATTGTISGGVPYTLNVNLTGSSIVSVWVDYNHNFVYEASEWTQVATASPSGTTPASVVLLVPATAVQGPTGMRIRSRGTGNANGAADACVSFGSGETKDFTLTIGAPAACPSVSGLAVSSITASGASVAFTPVSSATTYTVTVTPATGTATTQTVTASPITLTGLMPSTSYSVSIVGNCGAGQSSAPNAITFFTGCASAPYATVNNTTAYTQDFEAAWLNVCGTREAPDANWRSLPLTGNNAWRRDDDGTSAAWTSTSGAYTPAGSPLSTGTSLHSARFHTYGTSSGTRGTMDLSVNMAGTVGTPTLEFDYLNTTGTDSLKIFVSTNGGTSFNPVLLGLTTASTWTRQTVNLPAIGLTATTIIRLRATSDFGLTDIGVDNVRVSYVSCSAVTAVTATGITATTATITFTPTAGPTNYTVTVTPTSGPATTLTVTASPVALTGLTPSTGYTVSIVGNCGAGSTSQPGVVSFNSGCLAAPYATVNNTTAYTQDFEATWLNVCGTREAPDANWRTTPLTGNTSWRRDDDGTSAAWSGNSGAFSPAGSPLLGTGTSLHAARFHSYDATSGTRGTLDLSVNMAGTVGTPTLEFDYINTSGSDSLKVFVSTNGGTSFSAELLALNTASTWTHQTVNLPAGLTATTIIRLRGRGDFGITDIGVDNVRVSYVACAAVTNLTTSGITATGAVLNFTPPAGSNTYTVTVTPVNGTPTTVTPAPTASPVTLTGLTPSTAYTVRVVSNCGGGTTSTATTTAFTTSCVAAPYVLINSTTPYNQDFESAWASQCGTNDVPAVNWRNTPVTGNNSWRRDDDGVSAAWTSPTLGVFTPAGSPLGTGTSLHAARFHARNVPGRNVGSLDLYANMAGTAGTPVLTFDYINTSGTDSLKVFVSTNGGTSFSAALGGVGLAGTWTRQTVNLPTTGLTATTIIRLRAVGDNGLTDIGLDNVNISYQSCAAVTGATATGITATTATITFTPTAGPTNYTVTVTPTSGPATTLTVTASPVALTGLTPSTGYTVSIVGNCGAGSTSQPAVVSFNSGCLAAPYATVNNTTAYTQDFEATWLNVCGTREAPDANWRTTPLTGNTSWRRDDDGTSAAWSGNSGAFSPAGSPLLGTGTSLHAARFHSYDATSGTRGTMDLSVNMAGTVGTPTLEFDYLNTSGSDSLKVFVSTNGGTSFSAELLALNTASTWTHQTVNLPAGLSATTIIRLRGRGDFGITDIGVDNVRVSYIACAAAAGLRASGITTTGATVAFTPASAASYTVTVTPASGTPTTQTVTASPITLTGLMPGTSYSVSIVSNCGGGLTSQPATFVFNTLAVAPVNDDCAGALNVPIQFGTCTTQTTADNSAATTSTGIATPSCSFGSVDRDLWFKVTVPVGGSITVKTVAPTAGSNITDTILSMYSGTCGSLTEIDCNDDGNGLYSQVVLTGRTAGEVLYIRAWAFSSTATGLIAVCVTAPSNCAAPSGPTATNLANTTATLNWLAPTGGLPAGNTYELEYGVQGFTQGTGTSVTGLTASTYALNNLLPATDYCFYVRQNCGPVNGSSAFVGPTCFTTPLTAPTNDEPCGAVALGATTVTGSNSGSTTSVQNGINTPACSPAALPKDVWFSFTATATTRTLTITGTAAGMVRAFTSPDCAAGPFNQVFCQAATGSNLNVGPVRLTGLTVGTLYYVAVSGYGSSDTAGSFTILSTPTATRAQADTDALLVYPNPSNTGQLTLRLSGLSGAGQATLLNALGQVVATKVLSGTAEQTLSTRNLATGLYTLRVTVAGQVLTRKVVLE